MTLIGGVNNSSASAAANRVTSASADDVKKTLEAASKLVKSVATSEDDLQEVDIDETKDAKASGKTGKTSAADNAKENINDQLSDTEKRYKDTRKQYFEQLETLRQNLNNINDQIRNMADQMRGGSDVSSLQASINSLAGQRNQIYDSINTILYNISNLDSKMAENRAAVQNAMGQIDSLGTTNDYASSEYAQSNELILPTNANSGKGKNVIAYAEQFDDKNAGQMSSIMRNSGSAYHGGAWCADFVSFVLKEAYGKDNVPGNFLNSCPNTAYCPTIHSWAKSNNCFTTSPNGVQPGDIVLFDWNGDGKADHVGLFKGQNSDGTIATIEGNTTGAAGSSCVENKNRSKGTILGYVALSSLA